LFAKISSFVRLSVPGRPEGKYRANKILFGIRMCTYKLDRDNKRNGLEDFGEAKWGLTGCAMAIGGSVGGIVRHLGADDLGTPDFVEERNSGSGSVALDAAARGVTVGSLFLRALHRRVPFKWLARIAGLV
jgi:hypothetical protein